MCFSFRRLELGDLGIGKTWNIHLDLVFKTFGFLVKFRNWDMFDPRTFWRHEKLEISDFWKIRILGIHLKSGIFGGFKIFGKYEILEEEKQL